MSHGLYCTRQAMVCSVQDKPWCGIYRISNGVYCKDKPWCVLYRMSHGMYVYYYYYYYYYHHHLESAVQGQERVRTLYQSKDPNHTQPTHGRKKKKNSRSQKRKSRKVLALLLIPASPTPSNTGSLKSFQRDTERSTKVLRYWEVLQRGGANECV